MPFFCGPRGLMGDVPAEIDRLEALVRDLKYLTRIGRPPADVLERAPLIDAYTISTRETMCLQGRAFGHPVLGSREIATSELWVMAPHGRWCRTYSRYYQLGSPLVTTEGVFAGRWK